MIKIEQLDIDVLEAVRQNLGLEASDDSKDAQIQQMTKEDLFDRFLTWHGIIGYSDWILDVVENLNDVYQGSP